MKYGMVLQDQLPGAQMPPDVGINDSARRHGEQANSQNVNENPACLKMRFHVDRGSYRESALNIESLFLARPLGERRIRPHETNERQNVAQIFSGRDAPGSC